MITRSASDPLTAHSPLTLALESAMLPPPSDSAGARLLRKMGWRPGQGIGPRLTYKQRKAQDRELGIISEDLEDDEEANKHTYAPRDSRIFTVEKKDNFHGLGYKPGMTLKESLGAQAAAESGPRIAGERDCSLLSFYG